MRAWVMNGSLRAVPDTHSKTATAAARVSKVYAVADCVDGVEQGRSAHSLIVGQDVVCAQMLSNLTRGFRVMTSAHQTHIPVPEGCMTLTPSLEWT